MRRTLTFAAIAVALAAPIAPVTSANAVCSPWWQAVTGQCSPCQTVGPTYNRLDNASGGRLPTLYCLD